MPRSHWLPLALLTCLAVLTWDSRTMAFCRSTTCRGECPTDDNGCPSAGFPLFWARTCIGYSLQKNGTQSLDSNDVRVAIRKAFQAWSDVPCPHAKNNYASMAFSELEAVSCDKSQYNSGGPNVNVVLFRDDDWTYRGIDGTLAKTSVTYDDRTGEIFDADIEVNAAMNDLTVSDSKISYDLQAIVTHEVGHFIGMAHSSDANASMYASYAPGTIGPRHVTEDDVSGVCGVYPPGREGACDPSPRGGLGPNCDAPANGGCSLGRYPLGRDAGAFAALVALALVARRRRR